MTQELDSGANHFSSRIPDQPLIQTRELTVAFHHQDALKDVSVSIQPSDRQVIGESGCRNCVQKSLTYQPTTGDACI